jgi:hypothetical protein
MDLAGVQRLTRSLPPVSDVLSIIHHSTHNHAAIVFSYDGPACAGYADRLVRFGIASDTALQPQSRHLKGLRALVHRDRACVSCVSA